MLTNLKHAGSRHRMCHPEPPAPPHQHPSRRKQCTALKRGRGSRSKDQFRIWKIEEEQQESGHGNDIVRQELLPWMWGNPRLGVDSAFYIE